MTARKHSPDHDFWHARVDAAILDCIKAHPEYFSPTIAHRTIINSLAKRIVGMVIADVLTCPAVLTLTGAANTKQI